jgi:hypothetical protein
MISKVYNYVNRVPYAPIWLAELFKISSVKILVTSPRRTWKQLWDSMERMSDRLEEFGID